MKQAFAIVTYDPNQLESDHNFGETTEWFTSGDAHAALVNVQSDIDEMSRVKRERDNAVSPIAKMTYRIIISNLMAELNEDGLNFDENLLLLCWLNEIPMHKIPAEDKAEIERALREEFDQYIHDLDSLQNFTLNMEDAFKHSSFALTLLREIISETRARIETRGYDGPERTTPGTTIDTEKLFASMAKRKA